LDQQKGWAFGAAISSFSVRRGVKMKIVVIRSAAEMDATLRQELPELIKEAWRKVYVNVGAYTEAYEEDRLVWGLGMIEQELAKGSRWFAMQENGKWVAAVLVDDVEYEEAPVLQLRTLAVHPDFKGVGSQGG
jgi:predicted N-acetyltransferase YhbS